MSAASLPFPTKTRLRHFEEIGLREVDWFHFVRPEAINRVTNRVRTAAVQEFVDAELAHVPDADQGDHSIVEPTDTGRRWYRLGAGKDLVEKRTEGPGSTSPEPGPEPLAEAPTLTQIVDFLDPDGTLRAGHSTEDGA